MSTLVVKELTKTYLLRDGLRFSRLEAVKAVDFELSPGRTVALVGQSGSGKSTIAKLIAQLETPTSGSITLNGKPVGRRG
ncbi:MAG: ATP-binding cassette domain-containing protein, partial [Brachybacterium sp.]|nr:ATP-binding cassette domain-containing protein [Brachybacterium sp.]